VTDTHELAWLAGFWDGEGCTTTAGPRVIPQFVLGQAGAEGRELCERVLRASGQAGHVHGPYMTKGARSSHYKTRICGVAKVQAMLDMCRPWLSRTKIEQAEAVLARYWAFREANPPLMAPNHCPEGHEFTEENTYRSTVKGRGRKCRTCHREREAVRRAAKKGAA
jgi:hypothetical protein